VVVIVITIAVVAVAVVVAVRGGCSRLGKIRKIVEKVHLERLLVLVLCYVLWIVSVRDQRNRTTVYMSKNVNLCGTQINFIHCRCILENAQRPG